MSKLLVYGGAGALGRCLVQHFKLKGYTVINVDLVENQDADFNTLTTGFGSLHEQGEMINESILKVLDSEEKLCGILCVAGGWAGGNSASEDFLKTSELMIHQSVNSSLIAAHLASKHLQPGGLLTMVGALAAINETPGMMGYGIAKSAVHHLVKNLAAPNSGLPTGCKVAALLPITIDTPMNRKFMSNADFTTWTSPEVIASQLEGYLTKALPLTSGKLISVITKGGVTTFDEI
ncbi:uncharacterized protein BX663DRAFT_492352 [Cokeromyces recurvatus]|uniref:uncharacterized protein n=1 Tax=Cokeromyces recurvatus TaxID=90255 RepID=UPI00221FC47C|nr:uncharacterized protein BX663DRAFT_492352 [Cokeromyces recurvatus]KAI7907904.1 hypothetical protein BX663DRAFT_492352 [Cokeromyces recurvatus]